MIQRVREKEQLVYSISANSQPGSAYPGFGVFVAGAPTAPSSGWASTSTVAPATCANIWAASSTSCAPSTPSA